MSCPAPRETFTKKRSCVSLAREVLFEKDACFTMKREAFTMKRSCVSLKRGVLFEKDASFSLNVASLSKTGARVSLRAAFARLVDLPATLARASFTQRNRRLLSSDWPLFERNPHRRWQKRRSRVLP
jgi:hypothetical protein